jgi:hypothetical protein
MTDDAQKAAPDATTDARAAEPSDEEIEDWAARERARRQAWLAGPSDEERRAYASRVKHRRLAEAFDEGQQRIDEGVRRGLHYGREALRAQLANRVEAEAIPALLEVAYDFK